MAARGSRRLFPSLLGAIGVVLWATETTLITYTVAIPPLQTVAMAFGFAALLTPFAWWVTGDSPSAAFKVPVAVWMLMVGALVGYHACVYYATQRAAPAPAALLQGTTPLMIVVGSALLPGERLRWWHVVGAGLGFIGVLMLVERGAGGQPDPDAMFYLGLIGIAAALWGLYSVAARALPDVPSSALGAFYIASALVCFALHYRLEQWVQPTQTEWAAIAALGLLPMGLALYLWDFGVKHGDIQALGAFSYVEPFIGALLVAGFARGVLAPELLWSGALVVGGAALASRSLWRPTSSAQESDTSEPAISDRLGPVSRESP
jgi:drug/metabolite transporter (DMT)-like permease